MERVAVDGRLVSEGPVFFSSPAAASGAGSVDPSATDLLKVTTKFGSYCYPGADPLQIVTYVGESFKVFWPVKNADGEWPTGEGERPSCERAGTVLNTGYEESFYFPVSELQSPFVHGQGGEDRDVALQMQMGTSPKGLDAWWNFTTLDSMRSGGMLVGVECTSGAVDDR